MTADDYVSAGDQALVCSDLLTDDIVEAIIEKRNATNDQENSEEKLAQEPSIMPTRKPAPAFDTLQIYF